MSPRINFWVCAVCTLLNVFSFLTTGSLISLFFAVFCGYGVYQLRRYA